jgi:predicted tellurium resistance membrane protein TerC
LLFAIMTPIGNWLANNFESIINYHKEITAIAIGVFLHVSTTILLESSKNHQFNISKMSAVVIAILIAYIL